jgi:hypothetical protein
MHMAQEGTHHSTRISKGPAMIRRSFVVVAAIVVLALANAGFGRGSGRNATPPDYTDLRQDVEQDPQLFQLGEMMDAIGDQVIANMQAAGDDGNAFMQQINQQLSDGTLDIDGTLRNLLDNGYMTPDMAQQVQGVVGQMQVGVQRVLSNSTYNRIRQLLSPSDEEWAVLLPRVQRILDAQAEVAQGGDTMNRKPSILKITPNSMSPGFYFISQMAGPQGSNSDLGKAWIALQSAVADSHSSDDALREKLWAWRELHEKARKELLAAQTDLTNILTLRQEAVMLLVGVL